jgi:N-acyl-D-amino-acid deacylase
MLPKLKLETETMKRLLLILLFALPALAQYDVLIRNGRVIDGAGNPWVYADVALRGDRIVLVGHAPEGAIAKRTIDAKGLIVAPGFIDMLGQSETNLLIDKRATSKLTQGITTEITGEGGSIAPLSDEMARGRRDVAEHYHIAIDWRDLNGYFKKLEKQGAGVNLGTYVGAAQVRRYVIGNTDRPPTADELVKMQDLVDQTMRQGAFGVSSSLIYAPGSYAKTEELIALAKVAAKYGGIYASHIRSEADHEMEALDEAFRIGREANISVEIWHLKVSGAQNWGNMPKVVAAIEKARADGLDVSANQYPYIASGTGLSTIIPPKFHEGGSGAMVRRLKDPVQRKLIRDAIMRGHTAEDQWRATKGPEGVLIAAVLDPPLRHYEGMNVAEIAAQEKKDPLDAVFDLIVAASDHVGAIYFSMSEDDLRYAMKQPWVSMCTDSGGVNPDGPLSESKAHPRGYGSAARILGKYVREEHVLTLEDAVRKMTSLPAQKVKLADRGLLKPGFFADINIFNPDTVIDRAQFKDPHHTSVGFEYVFVNGVLSVEHGQLTGQFGGRPLRGPGYRGPSSGQTGPGSVRGFVSDTGGYPMGRVAVTIKDAAGKEVASAPVLYDGKFDIPLSAACQKCTITAARMGFVTDTRPMDFNGVNSLWFGFALKATTAP